MKMARTLILISVEMMGLQMHSLQDLELDLRQAPLHKSVVERPSIGHGLRLGRESGRSPH